MVFMDFETKGLDGPITDIAYAFRNENGKILVNKERDITSALRKIFADDGQILMFYIICIAFHTQIHRLLV